MFKSLRRKDIIILVTFWSSALCVVGILLMFFMIRVSGFTTTTYALNSGSVTALSLYPQAQEAALAWEGDVQFVSASATWNTASIPKLEGNIDWVYRFYSPSQRRLIFVIVTADQRVLVRPHLDRVRRQVQSIEPDTWNVDSPEAITAWLNQGGGNWLQRAANPVVSAQLTLSADKNIPIWTISGLDVETGQEITHSVEATTRSS